MKKLKKILLINWLYFSKEIIEVGDVNFLTGKNGAGKSTVIDALQIVLLGETNARNFNQAANEKSQRTLDGYLRADMDEVKRALTLLENHSIIQRIEGKFNQSGCKFSILPTVLAAVSSEKLNDVVSVLRKEGDTDEETEEDPAD